MLKHKDVLECLAAGKTGSLWGLQTGSSLESVLAPGFFAKRWPEYGVRRFDRINCVADINSDKPECCTLIVVNTTGKRGDPEVRRL
jgi:hypothetical protein